MEGGVAQLIYIVSGIELLLFCFDCERFEY